MTAGHTFYLEELNVAPGDFVSYYARAADNDAVAGAKRTTSDLYFLQIRPLRKEFKRAESNAGRWRRGRRQPAGWRAVAAATSDHRGHVQHQPRPQDDVGRQAARELDRHRVVAGEAARPGGRPGDAYEQPPGPAGPGLQEGCGTAAAGSHRDEVCRRRSSSRRARTARSRSSRRHCRSSRKPRRSTSPGQHAAQQGGGGGGGGQSQMAEDLADLFELEMDKMANQYETAQRAQQQQSDQKVDELAEKLKELARRQEQEAERLRQRAAGQQAGSGGRQPAAAGRSGRGSGAAAGAVVARGESPRSDGFRAADARGGAIRCGRQPPMAVR